MVGGDFLVGTYGTTCEILFGFVRGSRQRRRENHQESYPFRLKVDLEAMVNLIEEAAKEQEKPAGPGE